VALTE